MNHITLIYLIGTGIVEDVKVTEEVAEIYDARTGIALNGYKEVYVEFSNESDENSNYLTYTDKEVVEVLNYFETKKIETLA